VSQYDPFDKSIHKNGGVVRRSKLDMTLLILLPISYLSNLIVNKLVMGHGSFIAALRGLKDKK
jgi:hypothetical protein